MVQITTDPDLCNATLGFPFGLGWAPGACDGQRNVPLNTLGGQCDLPSRPRRQPHLGRPTYNTTSLLAVAPRRQAPTNAGSRISLDSTKNRTLTTGGGKRIDSGR